MSARWVGHNMNVTSQNPALSTERPQSLGEEIANSVSHGVGLLAATLGIPVLVVAAVRRGGIGPLIGAIVFGVTMVILYSTSTLYHALARNRAKRVFQVLDHSAIFLLIAGTYTPFALGVLRGAWGWTLLVLVWSLALAGVVLKATGNMRHPVLSTSLYLGMGWLVIVAFKPLCIHVPAWGLFWLLAGGIGYTAGIGFFAAVRLRYSHFIWHLFVMAGTACHFIAVLRFAF